MKLRNPFVSRSEPTLPDFVPDPKSPPDMKMQHRGGVKWIDSPVPPRRHKCWAQTRGWLNVVTMVDRCACGAISRDGLPWMERNSRRRG